MARGPIKLDCTSVTVVIVCELCDHWRAMRFTKLAAWECAAAHEARSHPELTQARDAYSTHKARHAASAS